MKKVAITGGLASGKTSVCHFLQSLGAYTVSADEIVHQLLSPHTELGKQVVEIFGHDIIEGESLDRKKIAIRAFSDSEKLKQLEDLLHPAVFQEIEYRYQTLLKHHNPPSLFVAEIPLLFEASGERMFDQVVVVDALMPVCRNRFASCAPNSDEQFMLRMQRQMPLEEKKSKADVVIMNNGTKEDLKKAVQDLYQTLTSK